MKMLKLVEVQKIEQRKQAAVKGRKMTEMKTSASFAKLLSTNIRKLEL